MISEATIVALIAAVIGAVIGSWASSYFQFQKWKRTEKSQFMWEFRLKLYEAEKSMWEANSYTTLMVPVNWLLAASIDPRIKIEPQLVTEYASAIELAWRDLQNNKLYVTSEDELGIKTSLVDQVTKARKVIEEVILQKISKLKIA